MIDVLKDQLMSDAMIGTNSSSQSCSNHDGIGSISQYFVEDLCISLMTLSSDTGVNSESEDLYICIFGVWVIESSNGLSSSCEGIIFLMMKNFPNSLSNCSFKPH